MVRWSPGRKYRDLRLRLDAVESLVAIKEAFSYEELTPVLKLPASVLSRYYQGTMVPNIETSRYILNSLLSKEFVKDFIYRLVNQKYGGDAVKLLSNPKVVNYLSIYLYNRIISKLAGTSVNAVIAPPDQSATLASHIAYRLGVPLALIESASTPIYEGLVKGASIERGNAVVAIYAFFGRECLPYLWKFVEHFKLDLKLIEVIMLADVIRPEEIPRRAPIDNILP